jgi:hypothetical protein
MAENYQTVMAKSTSIYLILWCSGSGQQDAPGPGAAVVQERAESGCKEIGFPGGSLIIKQNWII